jgi:hypothetical protein
VGLIVCRTSETHTERSQGGRVDDCQGLDAMSAHPKLSICSACCCFLTSLVSSMHTRLASCAVNNSPACCAIAAQC